MISSFYTEIFSVFWCNDILLTVYIYSIKYISAVETCYCVACISINIKDLVVAVFEKSGYHQNCYDSSFKAVDPITGKYQPILTQDVRYCRFVTSFGATFEC